ncbi:FAD-dependent oxidoreductase [Pseudonocardia humida]|uniref:FAD-dependent oxidoreductase n=1 Tax=Pseudonocardia humida TaxID=2800819 RepID=A0ABT1A6H9_9PSEU|nr:FAD-dependent oxidoreductase [Pseudonocardia humida]MCO1658605.1 FAD-dependent oxidoreductase [Pseudonocardia humida]
MDERNVPAETDVVVVGSGAAGLSAALAAAVGGLRVVLLEAQDRWGGTTGVSGGQAWVPGHHRGPAEDPEDVLAYLLAHTSGRDPEVLRAFVFAAPRMAAFVERHSPVRWQVMDAADSFADGRGGRNIDVAPVATGELGSWAEIGWPPPYPPLLTNAEVERLGLMIGGELPVDLLAERAAAGQVALGAGLVVGLLHGCRAAGASLHRGRRVTGLLPRPDGGVGGVRTAEGDVRATRGVVLACGGFEHDPRLRPDLLGAALTHPVSPPVNHGDALRLAASAGAAPAHLGESWSWPVLADPYAHWPGSDVPRPQLVIAERMLPRAIWVNRDGRRFVDESSHNCALALTGTDPATGAPRNLPAWAVVDAGYRERYPLAGAAPGAPLPPWVRTADTLAELAELAGIDPDGLVATVARFNAAAAAGVDPEFGRGTTPYDRLGGDPTAPHPNLGPLDRGPFHAVLVHAGLVGTKGGPRTDAAARVLDWDDQPVPGLYAAGNAMAAVIGPGTVSPGATIGSALTWGWVAGTDLAG